MAKKDNAAATAPEVEEQPQTVTAERKPGKFPRLEELYAKLFDGESFPAHNSMEDVRALAKCFTECRNRGLI